MPSPLPPARQPGSTGSGEAAPAAPPGTKPDQVPPGSKETLRKLIVFGAVGAASAVVDLGVFLLLCRAGLVPWAASALSFLAAFVVNYRGNRDLVFRAGKVPGALRRYVVLVGFNWVMSTALVAALTWARLPGWGAKLISMVLVAAINFVALRAWVFQEGGTVGSARWRAWRPWLLFGGILAAEFAIIYVGTAVLRDLFTPDGAYYYARTLRFLGWSEADAYAEVASVARPGWHIADQQMMFHYDLVRPRVVLPLLSAPFVALFGHAGLAVVPGLATVVFFGLAAWVLGRRYGLVAGLATVGLTLACSTWFYFDVAMLTESLSALWLLLTIGCVWAYWRRKGQAVPLPGAGPGGARWGKAACGGPAPVGAAPGTEDRLAGGATVVEIGRPAGWWLVGAAACVVALSFTRQTQLIPAGAFFVAWLGEWVRVRRARNRLALPGGVVVGTCAATQLLQLVAYPAFSQT
ncbi:MAG: GtrA family protein, partial [Bifidobacteriaceae bacterium]|nr:GtrA family protein [Bifidobacteriaceae bacterium]